MLVEHYATGTDHDMGDHCWLAISHCQLFKVDNSHKSHPFLPHPLILHPLHSQQINTLTLVA